MYVLAISHFLWCASTQKLHNTALNSCNFFVLFSRSCFFMVSKIYTIITMAQQHQFLMNCFFIWYVHTRMYEEFLEFFPEFFDLIISINRIFFVKNFQR